MCFAIAIFTNAAKTPSMASEPIFPRTLFFAVLAFSLGLSAPASATLYDMQWDPGLYGSLKQEDTNCPNVSCGPTAAVNSFVFLQNKYPDIYRNRLTGNSYQDWIDTANLLIGPDYMDMECCSGTKGGTPASNFVSGKMKYFDAFAPGTTTIHFQEQPTWQFLLEELKRGQDIEILLGIYETGTGRVDGHYVTVTGIKFDDINNNNTIDGEEASVFFVDPLDGNAAQNVLSMRNGFLELPDYWVDGLATFIEVAVAESPIPEPGTILLFVFGIAGLGAMRRRGDCKSSITS